MPFTPYFTAKDSVGLVAFVLIFALFVFYMPNYMGHADNYIEANPLSTPAHIVPEWYFLPFYAMLRAITFDFFWIIPAKLGGVLTMFASIGILFILPWLDTSRVRSCRYRPIYKWFMVVLMLDLVILGLLRRETGRRRLSHPQPTWHGLLLLSLSHLAADPRQDRNAATLADEFKRAGHWRRR